MKTILKTIPKIILLVVIVMAAVYTALAIYYHDHFSYGTYALGNYITGLSVSEANELIKDDYEYKDLVITDIDSKKYIINSKDIISDVDFTKSLETRMDNQKTFGFILNVFSENSDENMAPSIKVDDKELEKIVNAWPMFDDYENKTVEIVQTVEDGYSLVNTMTNVPNSEVIISAIKNAIAKEEIALCLNEVTDAYTDYELTDDMKSIVSTYEKIEDIQNTGIVYKFGDEKISLLGNFMADTILTTENVDDVRKKKSSKITGGGVFIINGEETSFPKNTLEENGFITDEDGNLIVSCQLLYDEVETLCAQYNSVGTTRTFVNHDKENIEIYGGTYGNKIDTDAEYEYILSCILNENEGERQPKYLQEALSKGENDIGSTYVEISIEDQKLYYYIDGEEFLDTDVVTGSVKAKHDTPTGVFYVYGKSKNRYLRGRGYVSFVKYWMPVYKGVGMHDASWRDEFGGDIYLTSGSHGCINLNDEDAKTLYENIKIGVPVIIY